MKIKAPQYIANHQAIQKGIVFLKRKQRLVGVVLLAMLFVFVATVIAQNNQQHTNQPAPASTAAVEQDENSSSNDEANNGNEGIVATSKLSEIVANPAEFTRTEVTVNGFIETVFEQRIFRLSDPNTDDSLFIITPRNLSEAEQEQTKDLLDGSKTARVTGTLRTFNEADLRDVLGISLPDDLRPAFANKRLFIIVKTFTVNR